MISKRGILVASGLMTMIGAGPIGGRFPADAQAPVGGRAGPVTLELVLDGNGAHLIGDRIPLVWRFVNHSREPLGFLWEGCCRRNGRLSVTMGDKAVDVIPASQTLAHMFAKAERLIAT